LATGNRSVSDFSTASHQSGRTVIDPRERQFLLDELRQIETKLVKRLSVIADESGQISGEHPAVSFHQLQKKIILGLTMSPHKGPLAYRIADHGSVTDDLQDMCGDGERSSTLHWLVGQEKEILAELSKRWHMFLSRNGMFAGCCNEQTQPS
jgi:hypothetical protein